MTCEEHIQISTGDLTIDKLNMFKANNWLGDGCINEYSRLLCQEHNNIHIFNTNFYKIFRQLGYNHVISYTHNRRGYLNIFEKDLVFFPIFYNRHWMLIVYIVDKNKLIFIDSFRTPNTYHLEKAKQYLILEERQHSQVNRAIDIQLIQLYDNPLQTNGVDCGVFVCLEIRYLAMLYNKAEEQNVSLLLQFSESECVYWRCNILKSILTNAI